jgi:thiol:disulfide interchange protein DsbD
VRNYLFHLGLLLVATSVFGQKVPSANWSYTIDKTEAKVGDKLEVTFTTPIPEGYHIYSNDYGDCPPLKAVFNYTQNSSFELLGEAKAVGSHHYIDDIFECEVADFEKKAEFTQQIKLHSLNPDIVGVLEYQMCTSDGMCVLFEYEFKIEGLRVSGKSVEQPKPTEPEIAPETVEEVIENIDTEIEVDQKTNSAPQNTAQSSEGYTSFAGLISKDSVNYSSYQATSKEDTSSCEIKTFEGSSNQNTTSHWGLFILAFLSGLAALLTPCVFPMIPMTVSFFMKDGSKAKAIRNGLIYGVSIVAIYVFIGTLVAVVAGPAAANWLSTHWLPNIFFFLIFVVFAASFFGAFEIVLPSWLVNKADQKADKGGLIGIFFMAFTIVLVSFSCTGPIVGSILVQSAGGAFIKPLIGMLGFSLAFAIPFSLFAIFPNWLNSLPASGGWLNSVKVVLGFLELAFGLKFLSVADQTYHWGILDREIYIGLWIVIFMMMGFYLLGKIKFSHDSNMPFLKVPRLLFAIATFSFVSYLVPGLFGAPLKALAGYLPPMSTHDFNLLDFNDEHQPYYAGEKPLHEEKLHLPDGLRGYFDYEQGMEVARKIGRPVFLDFTGHGCVNCREMEARVWSDPRVHKLLDEEYLVISLYVDEKTVELPKDDWFYNKKGKLIKTLAKKNSTIQECYFDANAQPQYSLLDNEGKLLQPTKTYDLDIEGYINFLQIGLAEYKARMTN